MTTNTYTVTLGKVYNNGIECIDPVVELLGLTCAQIVCIDEDTNTYQIEELTEGCVDDTCFTFLIRCADCDECGFEVVEKCLCDGTEDCGPCEECIGGVCEEVCPVDQVCDPVLGCADCASAADCPCNQVCVSGECKCPASKPILQGECCVECVGADDCEACETCVNGVCAPIDCGDDVCDPSTGVCVDCIASGDCDGPNECCINNDCQCCAGFVRINGICVPAPECTTEEDCPACTVCINGECVPQTCPVGQVCVDEFGCVPVCDCDIADACDDITKFCYEGNNGQCGCVPCQGTCTTGCQAPCVCDQLTQQCIANPCEGVTCTNGTECAEGCGCQDGECTPCATLSCATTECAQTLGCVCRNGVCEDDGGCDDVPCSVQSDCAFGCTCLNGECTPCSDFECPDDCETRPGCGCVGSTCQGEDPSCTDTLTLEKEDSNCTAIGTLTKDECCSCLPLTLAVRGKKDVASTATDLIVDFVAELRKGAFDGVSITANPRLDDFANENIAENEPPTSGTIRLTTRITYDIFEVVNSVRVFRGTSTSAPVTRQGTFSVAGTSAEVLLEDVSIPRIGKETVEGEFVNVVKGATLTFEQISTIGFPNQCAYQAPVVITTYNLSTNAAYDAFLPAYSNGRATTITSEDCRLPLFKWTKSDDAVFNEAPFRKLYVAGNGTYIDIIGVDEGLESCKYYLLDTDCTCKDDVNKYIVLCNPKDLDFTLSNCNKTLTINSFEPCDVNAPKQYRVTAGSVDIVFTEANAPIGVPQVSTTEITEVVFSMVCDTQGICTRTYQVANQFSDTTGLTITPDYICVNGGSDFRFTVPMMDSSGQCALETLGTVGGATFVPGEIVTLPVGENRVTLTWTCGCDVSEQTLDFTCCDVSITELGRNCDGQVVGAATPGVTYTVGGVVIANVVAFIESLGVDDAATITASRAGCESITFIIPSLSGSCCQSFSATVERLTATTGRVTVYNTRGTVTVDASPVAGITDAGGGVYNLTGLSSNVSYTITVTDSVCGEIVKILPVFVDNSNCGLNLGLSIDNSCMLLAGIDNNQCPCQMGNYYIFISGVTDLGDSFRINFDTAVQGFEAPFVAGSLDVKGNSRNVEGSGNITVVKPLTVTEDCETYILDINTVSDARFTTVSMQITLNGQLISNIGTTAVVTINGENAPQVAPGTYARTLFELSQAGGPVPITLEMTDIGGDTRYWNGTIQVPPASGQEANFTVISQACTQVYTPTSFPVPFTLSGLTLEDGCVYGTVNHSFTISAQGAVSPASTVNLPLDAVNPNQRKVKFEWEKDNILIFTDWDYTSSTLPDTDDNYNQGSTYDVTASCGDCIEVETIELCCPITIVKEVDECNQYADVTITAIPGTYNIIMPTLPGGSQTETVTILGGTGTQTVRFTDVMAANTTYTLQVQPVGAPACNVATTVVTGGGSELACADQTAKFPVITDANTLTGMAADYLPELRFVVEFANFGALGVPNPIIYYFQDEPFQIVSTPDGDTLGNVVDQLNAALGVYGFEFGYAGPVDTAPLTGNPSSSFDDMGLMSVRGPIGFGNWTIKMQTWFIGGGGGVVVQCAYEVGFIDATDTVVLPTTYPCIFELNPATMLDCSTCV